jgi:hypothetical protein
VQFKTGIEKTINEYAKNRLTDSELRKSFIIKLSIFKTTDTYCRETAYKNGCSHFWQNIDYHEVHGIWTNKAND